MKRLGNISVDVETLQNFREAFYEFSKHKRSRLSVQEFEEELEKKTSSSTRRIPETEVEDIGI